MLVPEHADGTRIQDQPRSEPRRHPQPGRRQHPQKGAHGRPTGRCQRPAPEPPESTPATSAPRPPRPSRRVSHPGPRHRERCPTAAGSGAGSRPGSAPHSRRSPTPADLARQSARNRPARRCVALAGAVRRGRGRKAAPPRQLLRVAHPARPRGGGECRSVRYAAQSDSRMSVRGEQGPAAPSRAPMGGSCRSRLVCGRVRLGGHGDRAGHRSRPSMKGRACAISEL